MSFIPERHYKHRTTEKWKRGMTYQDYTNHYITYVLVLEEHYVFIGGGKGVSGYITESLTVCHMCGKCHDSCT